MIKWIILKDVGDNSDANDLCLFNLIGDPKKEKKNPISWVLKLSCIFSLDLNVMYIFLIFIFA